MLIGTVMLVGTKILNILGLKQKGCGIKGLEKCNINLILKVGTVFTIKNTVSRRRIYPSRFYPLCCRGIFNVFLSVKFFGILSSGLVKMYKIFFSMEEEVQMGNNVRYIR